MSPERVVVVGAGLAGLRGAERLRELGWRGALTVIGDEPVMPYNRPPLSKQLLEGRMGPDDLALASPVDPDAEWVLGTPVTGLDPGRRTVRLADGTAIGYDGLIVATGVGARALPGAPAHDERVFTLRTLRDFRTLEVALARARRVAIVGGGFLGCEVAATARQLAREVVLVDQGDTLLGRALGSELGSLVGDLHRRAGVRLRLGTRITRWSTGRRAVSLHLHDGERIDADVVIVAIGGVPSVDWLRHDGGRGHDGHERRDLGLDLDDGVLCEPTCHVAGLDDVVAAGDVARWPNLRFDHVPRRVEHWVHAAEMGRAAAESLLAGRSAARPFTPVPRFWSEQYGVRIQGVGMPALGDEAALAEGSPESGGLVLAHLRRGELVGVTGVDSPRAMLRFAQLVEVTTASAGTWPPAPPGAPSTARTLDTVGASPQDRISPADVAPPASDVLVLL